MDIERMQLNKAAGYTHYITYEVHLHIADMWKQTGFPTTADALELHQASLRHRATIGEIRNVQILEL